MSSVSPPSGTRSGRNSNANQAFTLAEARRRARLFEPYNLCWFEEPLPADDIEDHARLAESTLVPIAVGESLYSLAQFREYLVRGQPASSRWMPASRPAIRP
jgi:L-alanine-DL-glutamate epimerase-like enolase superfamily enzyme